MLLKNKMGKIKGMKDIGVDRKDIARHVEDDIMNDPQLKYNSKIKIKAYDKCIEIIDKFIREKHKTRNIFYESDLNEIKNRITKLQELEDEKTK